MHYFATSDAASLAEILDEWKISHPSMGVLAMVP
jgi:hypothetical protein